MPPWRLWAKVPEVHASSCRRFGGKGYVAVCSNYRLTDVAPAPAQLHDVFSAIRFLLKMPPIMGLILKRLSDRFFAGGYLAVMAAVFDTETKNTTQCCSGNGAQTDLLSPHIQNSTVLNWSKFMGGFYRSSQNYIKQSPINHLSSMTRQSQLYVANMINHRFGK